MSSFYQRGAEKRRSWQEMRIRDPEVGSLPPRPMSPKIPMEQERRMRREVANSNERRRMQSINTGFQTLKEIIPHHGAEKLSKAGILQHASEYICQLEQEKTELLAQNDRLQQLLRELGQNPSLQEKTPPSPPPKRKKRDTESSDEGIGLACVDSEEPGPIYESKETESDITESKRRSCEDKPGHLLICTKIEEEPPVMSQPSSGDVLLTKWDKDTEAAQFIPHPFSTPSPASPPSKASTLVSPFLCDEINTCGSLARRNLDTIMEAIRHLEGDRMLTERLEESVVPSVGTDSGIPNSEESGTDNSYEDIRSDTSSGRDSPVYPMDCEVSPPVCVTVSAQQPSFLPQEAQIVLSHHTLHARHAACLTAGVPSSEQIHVPLQLLQTSPVSSAATCADVQLPQLLAQTSVLVRRS